MERRHSSRRAVSAWPESRPPPRVVILYNGREASHASAEPEHRPIVYSNLIKRCCTRQPGCQLYYIRWRKDKKPVCANPRCRRRLYTLLKLRHDGRMTHEELLFELSAMAFEFVDPVPREERERQLAALKARLGFCEIRAEGCLSVAVAWRRNRIPARRGNGRAPMACGNKACWRKAAALVLERRRRRNAAGTG
jgi:hypothetical protein